MQEIGTERLVLIAITPESVASEKAGDGRLAEITGAKVPGEWPPEHWEPHVFDLLLECFAADAAEVGWHRYIALEDDGGRTLIGTLGGFRRGSECEVGYSVLPQFQKRGYATEGLRAFIAWALASGLVDTVVAQTFPVLPASIRVMQKCGMEFEGKGFEEGTVLYRLKE